LPVLNNKYIIDNWNKFTYPNLLKILIKKGFSEVDYIYFDTPLYHFLLKDIKYKKSIFRIADNISGFEGANYKSFQDKFKSVINSVDTVLYTAETLKSYLENFSPKNTLYFPNGVDCENFKKPENMPEEYKNIQKPIILYVGAIKEWFDFELINELINHFPEYSFVFIGNDDKIKKITENKKNAYTLGVKKFEELGSYMHYADLGIIPFNVKKYPDLVNSVNPLKLYEYMICGLPVVATEWFELKKINSPAILCTNKEEFISGIKKTINLKKEKSFYIEYASKFGWKEKINQLLEKI